MDEAKPHVPFGTQDFRSVREEGFYYADRTGLISDLVSERRRATVFAVPRRFGKSLALSMIDGFFDILSKGNTWFDGLEVMNDTDAVAEMSSRPVVHLDLSTVSYDPDAISRSLVLKIANAFRRYTDPRVPGPFDDEDAHSILSELYQGPDEDFVIGSVRELCGALSSWYGKRPVVLIDEYDQPLDYVLWKEEYGRVKGFMERFLRSTLLENPCMEAAVVAGYLPYAAGTLLSGSGIDVRTVLSEDMGGTIGFSKEETEGVCRLFGVDPVTAWEWYGGYRFGDEEACDQWSLFHYLDGGRAGVYWTGDSGNGIVDALFRRADDGVIRRLEALAEGGAVECGDLTRISTMEDLVEEEALLSVLVMEGYLRADPLDGGGYRLSLPNMEMRPVLRSIVRARGVIARFEPMWRLLGSLNRRSVRYDISSIVFMSPVIVSMERIDGAWFM